MTGRRSITVTPEQLERAAALMDRKRIPRSTDRVHPITGEVLDEHEAMEYLVGVEAVVAELDRRIAIQVEQLKSLKAQKEDHLAAMREVIRIPTAPEEAPTPLFDE